MNTAKSCFNDDEQEFCLEFNSVSKYVDVQFEESDSEFEAVFGEIQMIPIDVFPYEGEYKVTPTVDGKVLKTKDKLMVDDLTVKPIPYFDTSNTAGGRTIYIADEV